MHGRELLTSILKLIAASVAMGAAVAGSSYAVRHQLGTGRLGSLSDLAISIPLGLAVFYIACRLLRVTELQALRESLGRSTNATSRSVGI